MDNLQVTPDNRHKHLIVRAEIVSAPTDCSFVTGWMKNLIEKIKMKLMFGPHAEYCNVAGNRGMTAFSIIETSHCAVHVWDECFPAVLQFDLYSCSDINVDEVVEELSIFEPSKIEYKFLDREHALILVEEK